MLESQEASNLGEFSREIILKNYSLDQTVLETIDIYERIIGGPHDEK
jgi:hypothetical protein